MLDPIDRVKPGISLRNPIQVSSRASMSKHRDLAGSGVRWLLATIEEVWASRMLDSKLTPRLFGRVMRSKIFSRDGAKFHLRARSNEEPEGKSNVS